MKVLVTGVCGQLGFDVMNELIGRDVCAIGSDIKESSSFDNYIRLDLTNKIETVDTLVRIQPDAVIHCAGWTAVDDAEEDLLKPLVKAINVDGTENIAVACKRLNIPMMYISTDYVFDGRGDIPWEPDCKQYAPLNFYGETKLSGELKVSTILSKYFIVRIAWAFGKNGNNFVKTMLGLADKGLKELSVVDDQVGTPTYTLDLARLLVDMIETDKYGYYHATNEGGFISWADFAEEIFKQSGKDVIVHRVPANEYKRSKAMRPSNSRLDKSKLLEKGFRPLPDWKDALRRFLEDNGRKEH